MAGCRVGQIEGGPSSHQTLRLSSSEPNNGQPESCFPQVFQLLKDGLSLCSAVLIAPNKLLTADHCMRLHLSMEAQENTDLKGFEVANEDRSLKIKVKSFRVHPAQLPRCRKSEQAIRGHDLVVLTLENSIPNVVPAKLGSASQGNSVRMVGFGMVSATQSDTLGGKRSFSNDIAQISASSGMIRIDTKNGVGACFGDSGGALFKEGNNCNEPELVGIASYIEGKCGEGSNYFANVETELNRQFVAMALNDHAVQVSTPAECCPYEFRSCVFEQGVGECKFSTQDCNLETGQWGACKTKAPKPEICSNLRDEDCNGAFDDGCTENILPLDDAQCEAACAQWDTVLCRPFRVKLPGAQANCQCRGKRVCAQDEFCSEIQSTCQPIHGSQDPSICGCLDPGTPAQRCRIEFDDAKPACATEGQECANLCKQSQVAGGNPSGPGPFSGGSVSGGTPSGSGQGCTLDGLCSTGETCTCEAFCCSIHGRSCRWNGEPTISYEDCFACGFHSDGETCWVEDRDD